MHLINRSRCLVAVFLLGMLAPAGSANAAVKLTVPGSDDIFVNVGLLLQPWYQMTAPFGSDAKTTNDFFIRRARPMLFGQITKWVSFFFETDNANWGKSTGGANPWGTSDFFVQDAVLSIDVSPAFHLMGGMILLPFLHHSLQGATTLNTLEYHTNLVKYPGGSNKVWRDVGVGVRGVVLGGHLEYRATVTQGIPDGFGAVAATATTPAVAGANTKGIPRITGRVSYNFFENEDALFYGGTYFDKKKILSVGLAFDVQPRAFGKNQGMVNGQLSWTGINNYYALGGDVFWNLPMGKNFLSGQFDMAYYGGDKNTARGLVVGFDAGYGIGRWEPVVGLDWYIPYKDDATGKTAAADFKDQLFGIHAGLNYWWRGHNANLKLDLGLIKDPGKDFGDAAFQATLQPQILF